MKQKGFIKKMVDFQNCSAILILSFIQYETGIEKIALIL